MENVIEIPKNQIIMAFVATCIEATARLLNTSYKEVYQRMKHVGKIVTMAFDEKSISSHREMEKEIVKNNTTNE